MDYITVQSPSFVWSIYYKQMATYIHTWKYVYVIVIINPNKKDDLNKEKKSMLFNEYIRYAEKSKYEKNLSKSEVKLKVKI